MAVLWFIHWDFPSEISLLFTIINGKKEPPANVPKNRGRASNFAIGAKKMATPTNDLK